MKCQTFLCVAAVFALGLASWAAFMPFGKDRAVGCEQLEEQGSASET